MKRREVLAAAWAVVATGCLTEATDDENNPNTPAAEETYKEVLRENELVVPVNRLPHEFEEGDEIVVEVRVDSGGPVTVLVDDVKEGEIIASKTVSTEATVTATAKTSGDHWIWVRGEGKDTAYITVARR